MSQPRIKTRIFRPQPRTMSFAPALGLACAAVPSVKLTCGKCTRWELFEATTRIEASEQAIRAGWTKNGEDTRCPKCRK